MLENMFTRISISILFLQTISNAYATCITNTSNSSTVTLISTADGACIENSGTITTTNISSAHGIYTTGADVVNTNTGTIHTTDSWSHGFYIPTGDRAINTNTGVITATGNFSSGFATGGANSKDTNSRTGTISVSGFFGFGMNSGGANSTITNAGKIYIYGDNGAGINSLGTDASIINSGSITISGDSSEGINSSGLNATIINSGNISSSGYSYSGIIIYGRNSTVKNTGTIVSTSLWPNGITSWAQDSTIINTGNITTSGIGYAVFSRYENAIINNSGEIRGRTAILIYDAPDNIVNLLKGSVVVGDIEASYYALRTKININLGAGASYAYSLTGDWIISDLDNRPRASGSAYAAGIGSLETASQALYQRTSAFTSALDLRARSYRSNDVDKNPYWLDFYKSDVTRDSGANYSIKTAFSNDTSGITGGFKLPAKFTPLELVVNLEKNNLKIDGDNQAIDSTSLLTGLFAPNVMEFLGSHLSIKALAGYAGHSGDRKIMTNSLLYDGSRKVNSNYHSIYAVLGADVKKYHYINDSITADALIGIDLASEYISAYKEADYFSWQDRTLNQIQSRIHAGLDYKFSDNKSHLFLRIGANRRDLVSGAIQKYSINGSNVSFNTNNKNDIYLTAQVGFRGQLEKHVHFYGVLNSLRSADSVRSTQINMGLSADF